MKKKYKIKYLPVAQRDLVEIIEYIKTDSPLSAYKFFDRFDKSVVKLEDFPFMGQIPKDNRLHRLKYRIFVIDSYLIFYVVKDAIVEIRRILHGKRRYSFLL
ncbi:MAG: type II toxin-antitoxin system RelE/ParE family toxin [Nitrospirae bacterium]|nr:type II toxin-antitoxin system RelE/ParE family toxin [Nitrospirota bacterium]